MPRRGDSNENLLHNRLCSNEYTQHSVLDPPLEKLKYPMRNSKEARWPSGRALDSGARGREFDPHSGRRVVSLSKIHFHPKKYW